MVRSQQSLNVSHIPNTRAFRNASRAPHYALGQCKKVAITSYLQITGAALAHLARHLQASQLTTADDGCSEQTVCRLWSVVFD
jgi:hypothetical protein